MTVEPVPEVRFDTSAAAVEQLAHAVAGHAAGKGDGIKSEDDDDGLVGINSQQMGYRLHYTDQLFVLNSLSIDTALGYVSNINAPSSLQMTSSSSLINQDHLDVIGLGVDTFDEKEFYAAVFNYIAKND